MSKTTATEPKSYLQLIQSVNPTVPTKGTNAGKQMYVINNKYWSRNEPAPEDTHVVLEDVEVEGKGTFTNVTGFSQDRRMSIDAKIKLLTSHDAGYSMAIASLLR